MADETLTELVGNIRCPSCRQMTLVLEWRDTLHAKPLGSFSLAGRQMKVSAVEVPWPWIVCTNCGVEAPGKAGHQ